MLLPRWLFFALLSAFFAGLTALFGKLGVSGLNSNLATLIRTIVILFIICLVVTWRREWGGVATGLSWLFYYHALQVGPVAKVAPIDKLSVAFAMLLGFLVLGERLSWAQLTGGALIITGSLIIAIF